MLKYFTEKRFWYSVQADTDKFVSQYIRSSLFFLFFSNLSDFILPEYFSSFKKKSRINIMPLLKLCFKIFPQEFLLSEISTTRETM
jgi:hypothetical protein